MQLDGGWTASCPPSELPEGEVQVWRARADRPAEEWREFLSDEEWQALGRFRFEADGRREAASRAARRILIGAGLRTEPRSVAFRLGPQGKPEVVFPAEPKAQFSASHSGAWAVVAIALGARVGVDIELRRPLQTDDLARRFFAREEVAELEAKPAAERDAAFFTLWTLKEAYLKGLGRGLSKPLDSFAVRLQPQPELTRCSDETGWQVAALPFDGGYAAALAAEKALQRCRTFTLR